MRKSIALSLFAFGFIFASCLTPSGLNGHGGQKPQKPIKTPTVNTSTGLHKGK